MNSEINLKDRRVPTFIQFEAAADMDNDKITTAVANNKKASSTVTKRKRTAATENTKPAKRKAGSKKFATIEQNGSLEVLTPPSEEIQVWVGAAITDEKEDMAAAYSIYYGNNDARNSVEIFKRENELQDLDYVYVLGTLKAIQSFKALDKTSSLTVNTTCRDLPRAIATTKRRSLYYQDMIDTIRELISENKDQKIQVRHVSGRTSSTEHKTAIKLANTALEKINQAKDEEEGQEMIVENEKEVEEEEKIVEEKIVKETTILADKTDKLPLETQELVEKALLAATSQNDEKLVEEEEEEEKVEQEVTGPLILSEVDQLNIAEQEAGETITTTTITTETTTVETKVEITINKPIPEEDQDMEEVVEEEKKQAAPLSWFGNLLDVLYAPFRKSSGSKMQ